MRGAIASVEIFVVASGGPERAPEASGCAPASENVRRLTLTLTAPERTAGAEAGARDEGAVWRARVALADLHRPVTVTAPDSVTALARALAQGEAWLAALEDQGHRLHRDRAATRPFSASALRTFEPGSAESGS